MEEERDNDDVVWWLVSAGASIPSAGYGKNTKYCRAEG